MHRSLERRRPNVGLPLPRIALRPGRRGVVRARRNSVGENYPVFGAVGSRRKQGQMKARSGKPWSAEVTHTSNALDLKAKVFQQTNPKRIALSLKRSAESSHRRKS